MTFSDKLLSSALVLLFWGLVLFVLFVPPDRASLKYRR